jgi:purine-binding chemotaxis protein CheW
MARPTAPPSTAPPPTAAASAARWCSFLVDGRCFAVDAAVVAEVLRATTVNRVPLAAPAIAGLLNLRGRIVPVIDMRLRLGFTPAAAERPRINLVIDVRNEWYSLLVDDLLDVVSFDANHIEPPSGSRSVPALDAVVGLLSETDRLVHFLDPERLLQSLVVTRVRGLSVG